MQAIVIVGAGQAGTRAALELREGGWSGPITLIGSEPGLPYERPPLSKEYLGRATNLKLIASKNTLTSLDIDYRDGCQVLSIDQASNAIKLSTGESVEYGKLLLATGASPRDLALSSSAHEGVHFLRTAEDARALQSALQPAHRIILIGGGLIGLEIAATARSKGADVVVIEAASNLLPRAVPKEIADQLAARHLQAGVRFCFETQVTSIGNRQGLRTLTLSTGQLIECNAVVACIGAAPETRLAERAGILCDNGILVDAEFHTNVSNIFACGDCCSFPNATYGGLRMRLENWTNAEEHGRAAARAMLGDAGAFENVPWFWSDQYECSLQVAGLIGVATRSIRRPSERDAHVRYHIDDEHRLVAASGFGLLRGVSSEISIARKLIERKAIVDADAVASITDPKALLRSLAGKQLAPA